MTGTARRVVYLTPSPPLAVPLHAGGLLQRDVTDSLVRQGAEVLVLAPAFRSTLEALPEVMEECTLILPELQLPRSSARGILVRLSHRLNAAATRSPLQPLHPPFLVALLLQPRTWRILREADVIDLQWFGPILLAPLVRAVVGRRPVLVGTFHDVVSQRLERAAEVEESPERRRRLLRARSRVRRLERVLPRWLDRSVVLSEKDRDLLVGSGAPADRVSVLAPRIEAPEHHDASADAEATRPTAIFVGYQRRLENHEAALWLIEDVWPRVRARVPGARLRIVGGGVKPELEEAVAGAGEDVELTGFVDDLWSEYTGAGCSVIPLRDGAGVKFKTIESLLAGVPTVATPIGAEGVGDVEDFAAVSDDPAELADGIVQALTDPAERDRSRAAGRRLRELHGAAAFDGTVARIYGL